jgi:hypothetical protein
VWELCGAFAVYAQAVFPAVVGFDFFEVGVGGVAHLGSADVGETGFGELGSHAFVVPHPEVAGAAEDGGGDGSQTAGSVAFAEPAFLHEAGAGGGSGVSGVDADELLEVGEHEAKGTAGTKIGEDVAEGGAELDEGHVLENVGTVDGFGRAGRDGKTLDDVSVADVFGVGREALFYQERPEDREATLDPEGGASVEVFPGFRSTHTTTKLHILVTHSRIIHSVRDDSGLGYGPPARAKWRFHAGFQ